VASGLTAIPTVRAGMPATALAGQVLCTDGGLVVR
jgi:hypothetical protein